jgi:hypothetical protein
MTPENAYASLSRAAEQIGQMQAAVQARTHTRAGRSIKTFRYCPTPAHMLIVDALPALAAGRMTAEEAIALLHIPEIHAARFGG